jgi:hypothetical protein
MREGPIEYFRSVPARLFAWLGGLVFAAGWLVGSYVAFAHDNAAGSLGGLATSYRLGVLLNIGLPGDDSGGSAVGRGGVPVGARALGAARRRRRRLISAIT